MNAPQPADSSAPAAASNDRFSSGSVPRSGIDLIIPFYRNAELVGPLFESLAACGAELHELNAAVVAINDSPEHEPLAQALREASARLGKEIPVSIIDNTVNLGFVRSCNRGLSKAATAKRDAVLLNSDTIVFPGAFREMVRVARLDPMIGFVSPRSNNVTIASPPVQQDYCHQAPPEAYASFQCLSAHLPDYHYAPTGVGFCLLVKHTILREFGLLDEAYGAGYNEENDLVMRANRCGYRAVLANKAFVYHHGEKSFAVGRRAELEKRNGCLLANRSEIADLLEVLAAGVDPFPMLVRGMTEPPPVHAEQAPEVDPALPHILQRIRKCLVHTPSIGAIVRPVWRPAWKPARRLRISHSY